MEGGGLERIQAFGCRAAPAPCQGPLFNRNVIFSRKIMAFRGGIIYLIIFNYQEVLLAGLPR
jgi:hypothetical protein